MQGREARRLILDEHGRSGDYESVISSARRDSIRNTALAFARIAPAIFQRSFERLRETSPRDYEFIKHHGDGGMDFIFFGMEKKIPVFAAVSFIRKETPKGVITVSLRSDVYIEDGPTCSEGKTTCGYVAGENAAVSDYLRTHRRGNDLVVETKRYVQLEIDNSPIDVGPPIRILRIDDQGPRWVQHGENCDLGNIPMRKPNNLAPGYSLFHSGFIPLIKIHLKYTD